MVGGVPILDTIELGLGESWPTVADRGTGMEGGAEDRYPVGPAIEECVLDGEPGCDEPLYTILRSSIALSAGAAERPS